MNVTYIKTKETNFDAPEYIEEFKRLFGKYLIGGFSIENGMYLAISNNHEENESEYILFGDDEISDEFTSMFKKLGLLISEVDITTEVKTGKCEIPLFEKSFKGEGSYNNKNELDIYLRKYSNDL